MAGIGGDRAQLRRRIERARIRGRERRAKRWNPWGSWPYHVVHLRRRPARIAVAVTAIASVGRGELYRQIRPRHAQAVIAARIDDHIGGAWHVARHAGGAGAGGLVVVVRRRVVLTWQVAGGAKGIALRPQLAAVRVMAVAASDPVGVHLALQERAPVINLAALLAVGIVKRTVSTPDDNSRETACRLRNPRRSGRAAHDIGRTPRFPARLARGFERTELPVVGLGVQAMPRRSSRRALRPLASSLCKRGTEGISPGQSRLAPLFQRGDLRSAHSRWCEPGRGRPRNRR